jgi:tRNA A58 N-methylase Trm61
MKLNPVFKDLNDPATLINHVQELVKKNAMVTPHPC